MDGRLQPRTSRTRSGDPGRRSPGRTYHLHARYLTRTWGISPNPQNACAFISRSGGLRCHVNQRRRCPNGSRRVVQGRTRLVFPGAEVTTRAVHIWASRASEITMSEGRRPGRAPARLSESENPPRPRGMSKHPRAEFSQVSRRRFPVVVGVQAHDSSTCECLTVQGTNRTRRVHRLRSQGIIIQRSQPGMKQASSYKDGRCLRLRRASDQERAARAVHVWAARPGLPI